MKQGAVAKAAADIVIFYLRNGNEVPVGEMGVLVRRVCDALNGPGPTASPATAPESTPAAVPENWKPAVSVRRSIRHDALTCLVCGKERLTLRRHLGVAHGLSPERYRELFGLWDDYPMDAAVYTKLRSDLAKTRGLGSRIKWQDRPRADPDRRRRKRRDRA